MKPKARFIASIVAAAQNETVQMPWARGVRRTEMIIRRRGSAKLLRAKGA